MPLQLGETLGRYQLEELVGQGGMAVVYRAVDSVLGRTVAVKVIRPAFTEDPQFLGRFLQEARLVANLDHPSILPLYDFGEESGTPYLVLPYLPGGSLAGRMGSVPQPLPLVAAWMIQLSGALDAAHARGVLHRDIKPGNVLVTKDGRLMLGDFGIARLAEATTRLTVTGMVVGTPLYMAPELARGADASPASDRYALAVMVYEMIAGLPPFLGSNPLSVLHQQVHEPVPPLAGRLPELPPGIDGFLRRALAKSPPARYPSARAMAEELVQQLSPDQRAELSTLVWAGGADATSGSLPEDPTVVVGGRTLQMPGPTGPTVLRSSTSAVTAEAPRPSRGSPLLWGIGVVAAVALALLLVPRGWLAGGVRPEGVAPAPAAAVPPGAAAPAPTGPSGAAAPTSLSLSSGAAANDARPAATAAPPPAKAVPTSAGTGAEPPPPRAEGEAPAPSELTLGGDLAGRGGRREVLELLRRPTRRMSAPDFQRLLDATRGAESEPGGIRERLLVLRRWAEGGLAYAQGREDEASLRRRELDPADAAWGVGWPALVFSEGNAWDLAAIYADPKHELDTLLQPQLRGMGGNTRTALAAAYSAHLDGNHTGAMRLIAEAGIDPSRAGIDPRGRELVSQFLTAEAIEARDEPAVRRWMPYAIDGGRAPLARPFLIEMMGLASENLGAPQALLIKAEACRLGVQGLCGPGRDALGNPEVRPLAPQRFGRRRPPGGRRGAGGGGAARRLGALGSGDPGGE